MGVLPLEFNNESAESIGLNGFENFDIESITLVGFKSRYLLKLDPMAEKKIFEVKIRIDTPKEWEYFEHGGILHYVIRRLVAK